MGLSPPPGARCEECEASGEPYYVYSCDYGHGGCRDDQRCIEMPVSTCNPGECCSSVTIECTGKHYVMYVHMHDSYACKDDMAASISCYLS